MRDENTNTVSSLGGIRDLESLEFEVKVLKHFRDGKLSYLVHCELLRQAMLTYRDQMAIASWHHSSVKCPLRRV